MGEGRHGRTYLHEFRRRTDTSDDFTNSRIETADYVLVSAVLLGKQGAGGQLGRVTERELGTGLADFLSSRFHAALSRKTAVAQGFVREVRPYSVIVACSENLPDSASLRKWTSHPLCAEVSWRIDKEEMASGVDLAKANLEAIFLPGGNGQLQKLRELVVDLREPRFAKDRCDSHALRGLPPIDQGHIE